MTWEEIIIQIRTDPAYKALVEFAYFEADLALNVNRFRASDEYKETLERINSHFGNRKGLRLADIGAGNGVAAVAFALDGFKVAAVEPDPSNTVGAGAIRKLKQEFNLAQLDVIEAWGEALPLEAGTFDVVYIRQAVHHAHELKKFIAEAARLLRKGGLLLTVRDHVIFDENDKNWFLESHPLHKFYGGENAFTEQEYDEAIKGAGLRILKKLRHFESVINYFPEKRSDIEAKLEKRKLFLEGLWAGKRLGPFRKSSALKRWYFRRAEAKLGPVFDERKIPGRMITYLAKKNA